MGNKSVKKFNWQDQYTIIQKNFNDGTFIVQKKVQNEQYKKFIGRQILINDQETAKDINQLVQRKINNTNPYITKLHTVYYSEGDAYCGNQNTIYLLFQYPGTTLKQQIICRRFANQRFSQEQAEIILQSGVKAIKYLKEQGHPHNNISSSSIFVDQDRQIIVGDPWATPPVYNIDQNQNGFAYPSPQKILYQNDQILTFDRIKSDLFSLGTVILQSLNLQHMDVIYEKKFRKVISQKIQQKIKKIKNENLRKKMQIILSYQPQMRSQIFNYYQNGITTAFQVKKRTAKLIYDRANGKIPEQFTLQQQHLEKPNNTIVKNLSTNPRTTSFIPSRTTSYNHNNPNITKKVSNQQPIKPVSNVKINFVNTKPQINYNTNINIPSQKNIKINTANIPLPKKNQFIRFSTQNMIPSNTSAHKNKQKDVTDIDLRPITQQDQQQSNKQYSFKQQSMKQGLNTSNSQHRVKQQQVKDSKQNYILQKSQMKIGYTQKNKNFTTTISKLKQKTPTQSLQLQQSQQFNNYVRKTTSQNSDRGFLQSINVAQQTYNNLQQSQNQTPEKRPKKNYNSTIKEVSQISSKQEDFQERKYQGLKRNGMRHGRGKLRYNQGSMYEGDWKNNEMHGYGSLYDKNGNLVYEGQWNQSQFHGIGKVYNQDQRKLKEGYDYRNLQDFEDYWSVYQGELSSDLKHGRGKIKLTNGQIFIGRFNNDVIQGNGQFHTLSGKIIYGNWKNNKIENIL